MSVQDAVVHMLFATAVFLHMHRRFYGNRLWRPVLVGLMVLWTAAVCGATLMDRTADPSGQKVIWIPFASYFSSLRSGNPEFIRSNLMNLALFYPAGLILSALLPRSWCPSKKIPVILVFCCLVSIGVEITQYLLCAGLAETDDVIHNTFGGLVGYLLFRNSERLVYSDEPLIIS